MFLLKVLSQPGTKSALKRPNPKRPCWSFKLQLDLKLLEKRIPPCGSPKGEHSTLMGWKSMQR